MANTVLHLANTRGRANHGWLNSFHTFSFAGYNNPERVHFGALRVLNDDTVSGGMGFGKHPHDNMEIISIPLSGDLEHQEVKFLQIWVIPNQRGIKPNYGQETFAPEARHNQLLQVVSPAGDGTNPHINQDAWFHIGNLDKGFTTDYAVKKAGNGVYAFVLEGDVTINGQALHRRDGFGIWETDKLEISADSNAELLLMEVPMEF
jgi:redox-sensitive bicupin YhaK (pirin superfamily)